MAKKNNFIFDFFFFFGILGLSVILVRIIVLYFKKKIEVYEYLTLLEYIMLVFIFMIIMIKGKLTLVLKKMTLTMMYIVLIYVVHITACFNKAKGGFQFIEKYTISSYWNMEIVLGIDGFSLVLMLLTSFLFPLCLISFWDDKTEKVKEFCLLYFILEFLTLNVFMQINVLSFYIFFESVLIPMVLIIGSFGSRERRVYAAYKFFFYTLAGSLVTVVGIALLYNKYHSLNLIILANESIDVFLQKTLWILFFMAFAVKIPMFPFHIWLPEAHAEAPTTGSVLLAGIMLKLGAYGFIRVSLFLFPIGSAYWTPLIYVLSVLAVIYISLIAVRQVDLKRIIAYSSVAHMGFVTAGLFSYSNFGILGAFFIMISHGLVSSALFFCIGVLYDRYKTRSIYYYSGLASVMPIYSSLFLFFLLANAAIPGTSSFIGEFLVITGCLYKNKTLGLLLAINALLVVFYSLWLFNRVCFGKLSDVFIGQYVDVSKKELFILGTLAIMVTFLGIYPTFLFQFIESSSFYLEFFMSRDTELVGDLLQDLKNFIMTSFNK